MRKAILLLMIVVATVCLWFMIQSASHKVVVRTYFHNSQGLISGARVKVDGVEVGFVRDVSVDAEHGNLPVCVRMALSTANGLSVPSDAIASLETEGVLGPTFVQIDTRSRTGSPVGNNGVLESSETIDNAGAAHALEVIGNKLLEESKKLRETEKSSVNPTKTGQ